MLKQTHHLLLHFCNHLTELSATPSFNPSLKRSPEASLHTYTRSRSHPPSQSHTGCAQRRCISLNFPHWHCWSWWCCPCAPWRCWTGPGQQAPCRSWARWSPDPACRRWSRSDTATEQSVMGKAKEKYNYSLWKWFKWFAKRSKYLPCHDGHSIRNTLQHFGSIWKKQNKIRILLLWLLFTETETMICDSLFSITASCLRESKKWSGFFYIAEGQAYARCF